MGNAKRIGKDAAQKIVELYTTPLPDGTWMGVPSIARSLGVTNTAVYYRLRSSGVVIRSSKDALAGKTTYPVKRFPRGESPPCKCGCGVGTDWNKKKDRWNVYVVGHYRKSAPYKSKSWLQREYIDNRRTVDEIASECGVSSPSIIRYMRRFGIESRDRSDARVGRWGGMKNPAWRGGVTPERQRLYKTPEWKDLVSSCFCRDGYRCVRCGQPKRDRGSLHAHHVCSWADHPDLRFDIANLVSLCRDCHLWVHSSANVDRDYIGD